MGNGCNKCNNSGFIEMDGKVKSYINDKRIITLFNDISFFKENNILPNIGNRLDQSLDFIDGLRLFDQMKNAYVRLKNGRR